MAEDRRMTAAQVVEKLMGSEHVDVVRESVAWLVSELMEAEVAAQIGAELGEVSPERVTQRNGYRPRPWQTRAGEIELRSQAALGQLLPEFPGAAQALRAGAGRRRAGGVRQRRLDAQGRSAGRAARRRRDEQGRTSRGCAAAWMSRCACSASARWRAATPTCGWTARSRRSESAARVRQKCLVIAYAVHESGRREVIGLDVGEAETEAFWREFLRGLQGPRPERRAPVRLRLPRGAARRDRPGARLPLAALHRALPAGSCSATAPRASSR